MSAVDYKRVNWKDYPETDTPITAENLNTMDEGIFNLATDIGDMDLIKDSGDGTVCKNLSLALGIKVYVGDDGKLHFIDGTGADSVLPFSQNWKMVFKLEYYGEAGACNSPGSGVTVYGGGTTETITCTCTDGVVSITPQSGKSAFIGWWDCEYSVEVRGGYKIHFVSFEWL